MELQNLDYEEIEPFFRSLTNEEEYYKNSLATTISGDFITGIRIDGELAGVGALIPHYHFFHSSSAMVKSKFRGKGVGSLLLQDLTKKARERKYSIILGIVSEDNKVALIVDKRQGYKVICGIPSRNLLLGLPLNWRGRMLCVLLVPVAKLFFSPLRSIPRSIKGIFSKRATHRKV